jgi:toxin ParE1/3/4
MSANFTVYILKSAEQDMLEIAEDVARRASEVTAERLLNGLLDCASTLEHFPDRGSIPSELAQLGIREFRQLIFLNYRLIYRVQGGSVFVHVIADGRRDMQQLLERRLLGQ